MHFLHNKILQQYSNHMCQGFLNQADLQQSGQPQPTYKVISIVTPYVLVCSSNWSTSMYFL